MFFADNLCVYLHVSLQRHVRQRSVIAATNFACQCVLASMYGQHMSIQTVTVHALKATTVHNASVSFPGLLATHMRFHVGIYVVQSHRHQCFAKQIVAPCRPRGDLPDLFAICIKLQDALVSELGLATCPEDEQQPGVQRRTHDHSGRPPLKSSHQFL